MRTFAVATTDGLEVTLTTAVAGSLFIGRTQSEPTTRWSDAIPIPDNSPIARPPSPTPTEIDDPEPEEHTNRLTALGIKVRDYASDPSPSVKPAVEVFDYQRACAEYDFIMMRHPRARPVPGKTLRRLLNLGFISEREQDDRWQHMDWDELRRYDSRTCHHPSRGYPGNGIPVTGAPTMQMRTEWLRQFSSVLLSGERVMNRMKEAEARAEKWKADTERVMERLGSPFGMELDNAKRRHNEDDETSESPKRQRLSPSPSPLPPGYKEVQIQPSPPASQQRTPPTQRSSPRGLRTLSRPLSRTESFRQL